LPNTALYVFCRQRCGEQHGINDGSFGYHLALLDKVSVDRVEDLASEHFGFKQVAELQQGRCVRREFFSN
jgi:hypothetical protein